MDIPLVIMLIIWRIVLLITKYLISSHWNSGSNYLHHLLLTSPLSHSHDILDPQLSLHSSFFWYSPTLGSNYLFPLLLTSPLFPTLMTFLTHNSPSNHHSLGTSVLPQVVAIYSLSYSHPLSERSLSTTPSNHHSIGTSVLPRFQSKYNLLHWYVK